MICSIVVITIKYNVKKSIHSFKDLTALADWQSRNGT